MSAAEPSSRVSRAALTWLPVAVLVGCLVAVLRLAARPLANPDTYFHLRFGEELLSGRWSLRDPGSVSSFATRDWLPTQWLPQVVVAWLEEHLGLAAVAWFSGLQMVLLLAALVWVCRRHGDLVTVALVVPLTLAACSPALSMRPQVLSYALMLLVVHAWLRAAGTGRAPWVVVPLTWLWACWHGMWPFALVVGMTGLLATALHLRPRAGVLARQAGVVALCAVAAALTPVGPGLYGAVLTVSGRARYFAEWGEPDYTSVHGAVLLLLGLPAVVVGLRRTTAWPPTLFLGLALGLALYSNRTMPLAAVTLAPLTAAALQVLLRRPVTPPGRRGQVAGAGTAVLALAVLAAVVPQTSDRPPAEDAWVAEELGALPPGTKVLNEWGDGGYVMWAHPHLDLLMHGYGDTFTTAELDRNVDIRELERGWDDLVRDTGVEVAFLRTDHPLTYALAQQGWRVVRSSEDVTLLEPPPGWSARGGDSSGSAED